MYLKGVCGDEKEINRGKSLTHGSDTKENYYDESGDSRRWL
jgi:hypothetical protein